MRRPPVRLSILVCVAASLATLLWASIETTGELTITPGVIDFDEVELESDTSRRLTFRNPNRQPALVRIHADCDCISLSHSELVVPARGEAAVDVTLTRGYGDRRERWYTFLESEVEVTAFSDDGVQPRSIPVKAKFFEPYAVDRAACRVDGLATELVSRSVSFSAAAPEAGQPTIGQIPPFVESVDVNWDDKFSAGELLVTVKPDTPPGLHKGDIEMRLSSSAETSPKPFPLTFEAQVRAPYRFNPSTAYLGGLLDIDSETVTLEGIAGVHCSIDSIACDSDLIRLEKHDGASFTIHRTAAGRGGPQNAPIIHVAIDVAYETDGVSGTVKEAYPVYVTSENEGGAQSVHDTR